MKLSEAHFRRQRRSFWRKIIAASSAIAIVALLLLTFVFWIKAVLIEVSPEAAALNTKLTLDGWGWVHNNQIFLLSPRANLVVAAAGFITEQIILEHDTLARHLAIELKEAPAIIKATATPADDQIQWYIDAQYVSAGAELQATVEPGIHSIEVTHPYYQAQQTSINLQRGTEKTVAFALEAVQGQLNISSQPAGVQVLLDDAAIGKTPLSMAQAGGTYRLQIETADFETVNDTIEVTHQQKIVNRDYQLVYKKALINFVLTPPGGQLMIGGQVISAQNMPLAVEPQRELIINYSKGGYFPKTIKRTFKPQQKEDVVLSLNQEFGKLVIKASPPADISIDNEPLGQTPQTVMLSALPHNIYLSKPGYQSIQKTIRPNSRHTIYIDETLLTEKQARLAASPAVYKNFVGIELLLFTPQKASAFALGAHRSEKGQRANEVLRTVTLDRAFYVSRTEISAQHYHAFDRQVAAQNVALSNVSWREAALFCNWLSSQENLPHFYASDGNSIVGYNPNSIGYRLLSEAEWEWLARYAKRSAAVNFIWGNQATIPKGVGNFADESAKSNVAIYIPGYNDGYPRLAPVASFTQDSAGLYDMAGNVSEWVHDSYTVDSAAEVLINPLGSSHNTERSSHVVKGSSWRSGTLSELRSMYRQRASGQADDIGFRIARYIH